ncbi:HPr kinase/phosphorylase [Pararhizobium gei]|uniref:HPr kinase/phosphorylase n=1 Tax=Pararhizobium gei TaxID=1395951 RepID=UPI0023DCC75F|nr:HPr kinase/phosphorylase [Rhizobium gei]
MTGQAPNLHATAIVLGTQGFLFVGPSGAGKTTLALSCLTAARANMIYASLIADDQVLISIYDGLIIARRPASIAGLAEIRGAGIVTINSIPAARLDFAVLPVKAPFEPRLPPDGETWTLAAGACLPLLRLPYGDGSNAFEILRVILSQRREFQER